MNKSILKIKHYEDNFKLVNGIELDDLETIVNSDLRYGLPSDTVYNPF